MCLLCFMYMLVSIFVCMLVGMCLFCFVCMLVCKFVYAGCEGAGSFAGARCSLAYTHTATLDHNHHL